jgi:hypothetical protein
VVPSIEVHEPIKVQSEFDNTGSALYKTTFLMTMNKPRCDHMPPDLKTMMDANSGTATSDRLARLRRDDQGREASIA